MEGIVTKIVPLNKTKNKVFIEDGEAFVLYKSECGKYSIEEGKEITAKVCEEIFSLLKKRAVSYAVHLLEASDRTEGQIRDKLSRTGYPQAVSDYVIEKLAGYRYINDRNYAENFVQQNSSSMSIKEMENKLYEKKVPVELIKEALEAYKDNSDHADEEAFLRLFNKKRIDPTSLDIKEKRKIVAYFLRKGFSYELIRSHLHVNEDEMY